MPVDILTSAADRSDGRRRDHAGDPDARAVVQLPAPDDLRRHRLGAAGDAARPWPRSGARARQRQAAASDRADPHQQHDRPRIGRRRPQRDSGVGHRAHRDPARRRRGAVRVRRHRRRHQHRPEVRACRGRRCRFAAAATSAAFTDVFGTEHDFTDGGTFDASGSWGCRSGRADRSRVAAEYRDRQGTNRAGPDTGDAFSPQPNIHWGDSEEKNGLLFANAEVAARRQPAHDRSMRSAGGPAGPDRTAATTGAGSTPATCPAIYPNGFLPLIEPINVDASIAGGRARRRARVVLGRERRLRPQPSRLLRQQQPERLARPDDSAQPDGVLLRRDRVQRVHAERRHARGRCDLGLARPANLAFGVEYRRDNYQIVAGEPALVHRRRRAAISSAIRRFPARRCSRDSGRRMRPTPHATASRRTSTSKATSTGMLRLGGAGRWEHFDDFGNTGDGKFTARLQPHKRFVVRGAVSTGFPRAVARPDPLLDGQHEFLADRRRIRAGRGRNVPGGEPAGASARRHRPDARRIAPLQRRRRASIRSIRSRSRSTTTTSPSTIASCCRTTSRARASPSCCGRSARTARATSPTPSTPRHRAST